MEETLGKRIVANRKRLGITQDRLAEQLGVTAQAVSKWENDQSCPDITMLPKLAEIFGISADALLGISTPESETVYEAEVLAPTDEHEREENNMHAPKNNFEFRWDAGRKGSVGMAVWVLMVGGLLLASMMLDWDAGFWDILWPSALLVFGLFGLLPKFSFFSLGCTLFGGYFLLDNLGFLPAALDKDLLLPVFLLLFGLSLLFDALRKPKKAKFSVTHNGRSISSKTSNCSLGDESFDSVVSFGEGYHLIDLPQISCGTATVSFGESTVDLTGCNEIAPGCNITATCSFGDLTIRVPRKFRVETNNRTSFASVEVEGHPDADPMGVIAMDASVSFGEITIQYI